MNTTDTFTLFRSEHAYRIVTALLAMSEAGEKELLIPDVAYKAMTPYGVTRHWINMFTDYGFIRLTRYGFRENALRRHSRHVVIHITNSKLLGQLYTYMWIQNWEEKFKEDLKIPNLQLLQKAA
jgi:hypothetical protein